MGKRTDYPRKDRDFYPTPAEAVVPLIPHLLYGPTTFDEPCAGDGALVGHLEYHGMDVGGVSDIEPQSDGVHRQDALTLTSCEGDMFITNPPWAWPILKDLMPHLYSIAPTWLLLNADLMHNKRMGPHMQRCVKVVSVGRVSWMGNGKKGFENCAWFLFDGNHVGATEFYGR